MTSKTSAAKRGFRTASPSRLARSVDLPDDPRTFIADQAGDADGPETVRVRMTVDLVGPLAGKLEETARQLGKSKTDVIRDGLQYVFRALKAQHDGFLVGAWKEDEEGRISRAREFSIGGS